MKENDYADVVFLELMASLIFSCWIAEGVSGTDSHQKNVSRVDWLFLFSTAIRKPKQLNERRRDNLININIVLEGFHPIFPSTNLFIYLFHWIFPSLLDGSYFHHRTPERTRDSRSQRGGDATQRALQLRRSHRDDCVHAAQHASTRATTQTHTHAVE